MRPAGAGRGCRRQSHAVGDVATSAGWLVTGTNGEYRLEVFGPTQAAAWWRACEAARAVGMLAGLPDERRPGAGLMVHTKPQEAKQFKGCWAFWKQNGLVED